MENQATAISDSGKSASKTVTITRDGQVENVVLSYQRNLFSRGEVSEKTYYDVGLIGKEDSHYKPGYVGIKGSKCIAFELDLSEYKTLILDIGDGASVDPAPGRPRYLGVWPEFRDYMQSETAITYKTWQPNNVPKQDSVKIDVSKITGVKYVEIFGGYSTETYAVNLYLV